MSESSVNYVYVDEEGSFISVYDSWGDYSPREFGPAYFPLKSERRAAAEREAAKLAAEAGCEWGSNYGGEA